jgi:hypothetical protein
MQAERKRENSDLNPLFRDTRVGITSGNHSASLGSHRLVGKREEALVIGNRFQKGGQMIGGAVVEVLMM